MSDFILTELILLTDGVEIKVHTRNSGSRSTKTGYEVANKSYGNRITNLDYRSLDNDQLQVSWSESYPPQVVFSVLDLVNKSVVNTAFIDFGAQVSSLAFDKCSCLDNPSVFVSESGRILRIYQNKTVDVILDHSASTITSMLFRNGFLFWSEGKCIQRMKLGNHHHQKEINYCIASSDNKTMSSFHILDDDSCFIMSSSGDVVLLPLKEDQNQNATTPIIDGSLFRNESILKYHENTFKTVSVVLSKNSSWSQLSLFIGIQNHGLLMEVKVSCVTDFKKCDVLSVEDIVVERLLPDFKLLTDNDYPLTCINETAQDIIKPKGTAVKEATQEIYLIHSRGSEEYIRYRIYSRSYIWILVLFLAIIIVMACVKTIYEYKKSMRDRLLRTPRESTIESGLEESLENPFYESNRRDHRTTRREGRRSRNNSVTVLGVDNTVSIEDLGGFSNLSLGSHTDNMKRCSRSCDSCEYKTECKDRGICLSTYRLLT